MIEIVNNNQTYYVNEKLSLQNLLDSVLITLPLELWKDILKAKGLENLIHRYYQVLKAKIKDFDLSKQINSFIYKGNEYWFDKNTRIGLMHLANCSDLSMLVKIGDNILDVSVESFKEFLKLLEIYSGKCYITTLKHLQAIKLLKTIDEMLNYNYTYGYPEKLILNEI